MSYFLMYNHYKNLDSISYESLLASQGISVRESRFAYHHEDRITERHLQSIWYDERLRPPQLQDSHGEPVEVVSAGRWNLEAGPDFIDATLLVGVERRRLVGDVEIHIHPRSWREHGHAENTDYDRVIAHVTYFESKPEDPAPPQAIKISLREPLRQNVAFNFDDIDLSAYPHAIIPVAPRPCAQALGGDPDRTSALLRSAGRYRLDLKRQRMQRALGTGRDHHQTLFEFFMAALGYKQNTQPFRQLAQLMPVAKWPAAPPLTHYARLMSAASLLPAVDQAQDAESRSLLRKLWELAWRNPAPLPKTPLEWKAGAMRPANHPARRLAVAAAIFWQQDIIHSIWDDLPVDAPKKWFQDATNRLRQLAHLPCWDNRHTLTRISDGKTSQLLGKTSSSTIITNVIIPYLLCTDPDKAKALVEDLPGEAINSPMRTMATRLLGRDHNPALYSGSGLMQQGLLQIFNDFCLNSIMECSDCTLVQSLQNLEN